jgi:filamentous hemagglutinin family protein
MLLLSDYVLGSSLPVVAQTHGNTTITPDTSGRIRNTTVMHAGQTYHIRGGTVKGDTVFHSFQRFQVGTREQARFEPQPGIANILSRVTGGERSIIDGTLSAPVNLFFLNPAGVFFGPHACLEVNGSFYVSTANTLRAADGTTFYTNPRLDGRDNSVLRLAAPESFGFLTGPLTFGFTHARPAPITIERSDLTLQQPGNTLALLGGNIAISGGTLRAPNGQLNMASMAARGDITLTRSEQLPGIVVDSRGRLGTITLARATQADVIGNSSSISGTVVIRGGQIRLLGVSQILANTGGSESGRSTAIDVAATESILIAGQRGETSSSLSSSTSGSINAGSLTVTAPRIHLAAGGKITASTVSQGNGGNITVRAPDGQILLTGGGQILSTTSSGTSLRPAGQGGSIRLEAGTLTLDNASKISVESTGRGNAGTVTLEVGRLHLTTGSRISSSTSGGGGIGGTITITATDTVLLAGGATPLEQQMEPGGLLSTTTNSQVGGDIILTTRVLMLRDGVAISAASRSTGNAGTIRLTATEMLASQNSAITTEAQQARGGAIEVTAHRLARLQHSRITTTVLGGDEQAGDITLDAEFVVLQNSQMQANAVGGPGGDITIRAQVFLADPTSAVTASSVESIDGEINIQAPVANLSGVTAPLPQDYVSAAVLLRDPCAARLREGTVSSLVARERDGIPATPEGMLPSRRYSTDAAPGGATTLPRPAETMATSPGGLQTDATGQIRIHNWAAVSGLPQTPDWPCASR